MPTSLEHVTFVVTDVARSATFYDAALGALGLSRLAEFGDEEEDEPEVEAVGWGDGQHAVLWVVAASARREPTRNAHLRLAADGRACVERFHAAAVAAGGRSRTAPRRWAIFRAGEFLAAVDDPDGNTVEIVAAEIAAAE